MPCTARGATQKHPYTTSIATAQSDPTGTRKRRRHWPTPPTSIRHNEVEVPRQVTASPDHPSRQTSPGTTHSCTKRKKRRFEKSSPDLVDPADEIPWSTQNEDSTLPAEGGLEQSIASWARTGEWPSNFATMNQERSISPQKRSRTTSYTQSVKDGDAPRAYSPAFETVIAEHGLHMEVLKGRRLVSEGSKTLCQQLLQAQHERPAYSSYPLAEFLSVQDRVRTRNESKIFRDLTPLLVPSPELLFVSGHQALEHVRDEISVEWSKGKTMGGPRPKPDCAIGMASSAFTDEESAKLKNYASYERPTLFTDHLYFPFLLCETKCGNEGLDRADRQNMHSGSIAVDAIVQLYRAIGSGRESALNGEIIVFSISHNHESVKLYGHFPIIQGAEVSFYRYHATTFILGLEEEDWRRPHDCVREIYKVFYPAHLQRIRHALSEMGDPRLDSTSEITDAEEIDSQIAEESTASSQDAMAFKIPNAPASKKVKGGLATVGAQFARLDQHYKEQLAKQEQHYKEQLAKQEQHYKEQMEPLRSLLDHQKI